MSRPSTAAEESHSCCIRPDHTPIDLWHAFSAFAMARLLSAKAGPSPSALPATLPHLESTTPLSSNLHTGIFRIWQT